eukprot:6462518-Amphidinium_carterae.2
MDDILEQRARLTQVLQKAVKKHTQIPVALGHGASSLEHKLRAFMHALWMETPLPHSSSMPRACESIMSFTTDMGTESALPDYQVQRWTDLLPSWMRDESDQEPAMHGSDSDELFAEPPAHVRMKPLFPQALLIPGALHMFDNTFQAVDHALGDWVFFLDGLRALASLLAVKYRFERFLETCVRTSEYRYVESTYFKTRMVYPAEWRCLGERCSTTIISRWGAIRGTLRYLLARKNILRACWKPATYDAQSEVGPSKVDEDELQQEGGAISGTWLSCRSFDKGHAFTNAIHLRLFQCCADHCHAAERVLVGLTIHESEQKLTVRSFNGQGRQGHTGPHFVG